MASTQEILPPTVACRHVVSLILDTPIAALELEEVLLRQLALRGHIVEAIQVIPMDRAVSLQSLTVEA